MKIFITGSSGFIGFHTAKKLLEQGREVVGIDSYNNYYDPQIKYGRRDILKSFKNFSEVEGSICDRDLIAKIFKKYSFDVVCHLAAQAGVRHSLIDPYAYEEANVRGFLTVLEAARHNPVSHFVYASSASVYGNNSLSPKGFSESERVDQPLSLYGATKRANELMAYSYHHLFSMRMTGLRFFSVYGPWGRPDMALYKFTEGIMHGRKIDVYNHGKMKRNFTYIDDIVAGVISSIDKPFDYEIFNLGNDKTVKLNTFVELIEKELGKKAKINYLPMQVGDVPEALADITHAKKLLGFVPKTDVPEGIKAFVDWYKEFSSKK